MSLPSAGRHCRLLLILLIVWAGMLAPVNAQTRVAGFSGTAEYAPHSSDQWAPLRTNTVFSAGDRIRTGPDGHVILQLSDRSVIRMDRSSLVELKSGSTPEKGGFLLRLGRVFFLNREKPSDIEFETPLVTGAIRGTEFVLATGEDRAVSLALLEGEVSLTTPREKVDLACGEEVQIDAEGGARKSPLILAQNAVQWALYYPVVLNPDDLPSIPDALKPSVAAYKQGDVRSALRELPSNAPPEYAAAVQLAAGDFDQAGRLIEGVQTRAAEALRELISAVKFQELPRTNDCQTSSEWLARSYYWQSRSELRAALAAAEQAARIAPGFGPAQARRAELLFAFGRRQEAMAGLETALEASPRLASVYTLRGFGQLEQLRVREAEASFAEAIRLDERIGNAWLGQALCQENSRQYDEGRRSLEVAAALEPQRSVLRSYLGKAWSAANDPKRAEKELALARKLDAKDPTPFFYAGLHLDQENRFNEAIADLERSAELNDNRSVFRSRLGLDQDRSARSADLAAIYEAVGMSEVSERTSARAVSDDYANFAGHLFRARSLQRQEDINRVNLRYESPRESELLVANLLAPPGAGNLSQVISQQEHLRLFDQQLFGFSSTTEYRSSGDWLQSGSFFGQAGGFGYAVDGQYLGRNGAGPNQRSEETAFSVQAKEQVTASDSVYLQAGWMERTAGDGALHYDPNEIDRGLHVRETQAPVLYAGWHHEWAPGSHTLLLAGRLDDELKIEDRARPLIFVRRNFAGAITDVDYGQAAFDLSSRSQFTLYNLELQQIVEREQHTLIAGARFQSGSFDTQSLLAGPVPPPLSNQRTSPDLERISAYGYYTWRPLAAFSFTAGLSYDRLTFPENVDLPPLASSELEKDRVSPKVGLAYAPFEGTWLRAAYTRSLGGVSFDNSIRLEPTQVAGFNQTFRSLAPESAAGLIPGAGLESWEAAWDQTFRTHTYFGVAAEMLRSDGERTVGAVANSIPVPVPDTPIQLKQDLRFEERSLSFYANQLIGREWSVGGRYRLSDAKLEGRFPGIPASAFGADLLAQDQEATLHQGDLFVLYNHPSGFFGEWDSAWFAQSNRGYNPARPGDDFWQHNLYAGYRFRRRRAEIRVGIENLAARDYQLNPLNYYLELPRDRTFVARLKLNF